MPKTVQVYGTGVLNIFVSEKQEHILIRRCLCVVGSKCLRLQLKVAWSKVLLISVPYSKSNFGCIVN